MDASRRLPPWVRWLWISAWLALGALPSFAFFVWVERNLALPRAWNPFEWPWIQLPADMSPVWASLFNGLLFVFFGFFHSLLAQSRLKALLARVIPLQAMRALYLMVTGLTLCLLMGAWQHTGLLVWVLPLNQTASYAVSAVLFWGLMLLSFQTMKRFNGLEFVGLWQLFQHTRELAQPTPTDRLYRDGIYAWVRHPIYLFTTAAFLITPVMTWDRLWLSLVMLAYLAIAIPIEERKLIALFGDAYLKYRREVPALIPRWRSTGI